MTEPNTGHLGREHYLALRRRYEPANPKLIVVAESPPASGKYFYNPDGAVSEPLFSALMQQMNVATVEKAHGLREFQRMGWVLVDATYQPVNRLSNFERDNVIRRDYPQLAGDIARLCGNASVPIILLKANVCRLLEPLLTADGFTVVNRGRPVYFPSSGQQGRFRTQFQMILEEAGFSAVVDN